MDPNQQQVEPEQVEPEQDIEKLFKVGKLMNKIHELFIATNENRRLRHLRPLKWDDFFEKQMEEITQRMNK
jgi:hypothetical protein